MARPTIIDDDDLLAAARAVFLEHGIQATTAEVARRARVSEGTLFHRFGSKAGLFHAAMRPRSAEDLVAELALPARIGKGQVAAHMTEAMEIVIDSFKGMMPLMRRGWSNRNEGGNADPSRGTTPPPTLLMRAIAGYLEAEMRGGRLRRVDAEVLARTLTGGAWGHVFHELMAQQAGGTLPLARGTFVRGLVDIALRGVEPKPAPRSRPQRRRPT